MRSVFSLAISLFFCWTVTAASAPAQAAIVEESLPKTNDGAKKLKSLREQKRAEVEKRWLDCANLAPTNLKKASNLAPWIVLSWMNCASQIKSTNAALLIPSLKAYEKLGQTLVSGPWEKALRDKAVSVAMLVAERSRSLPAKAGWESLDRLLKMETELDASERARLYGWAGQRAQKESKPQAAKNWLERSLELQSNQDFSKSLESVNLILDIKKPETDEPPVAASERPLLNEKEERYRARFEASQKANDLISLMEDCSSYLKDFPVGQQSSWADEKLVEIYLSFFDRGSDEKFVALREKALSLLKKSEATRKTRWAKTLHRRGDYPGSVTLAESALADREHSPDAADLLYIVGRSSQFIGNYKSAQTAFEELALRHAGYSELPEVLFRLGLVHLRQNDPASAIGTLERLLTLKNIDRYDLSARYWIVRALQMQKNNERATTEIDAILKDNMFSYYGLKLLAEKQNQTLEWPTPLKLDKPLKAPVWLMGEQKTILQRARDLAANDWYEEAQKEINQISVPMGPALKILWAQELVKTRAYPRVLRLVNDAGEIDESLKALEVMSLSYPKIFEDAINAQAKRQKLSPYLVRSLIRQESAFAVQATSVSNALGLMQLIPPTADEVAKELGLGKLDLPRDAFIPETNIEMGTYYIAKMIRQFGGNVPLALAAYNAGPTRMKIFMNARDEVKKQVAQASSQAVDELWYDEVPWFETSFYVKAILRNVLIYKMLDAAQLKGKTAGATERKVALSPVVWSDLVLSN